MGTFENQPTLKNRVCQECDTEIGKCEGQLVKCGIEAMLRIQAGIIGRSGRNSPSPFRQRHYGYGPITVEMEFPYTGWRVLVEPREDGSTCEPLPQIVMIGSKGHCGQIPIREAKTLTAEMLKREIATLGQHEWRKVWAVQLDDADVDHIFGLLDQIGILGSEDCLTNIRPLDGTIKMRASGIAVYGREYFRAIAKIAFHYFLLHSHSGLFNGSEPEFERVRRFIRHGEGSEGDFVIEGSAPLLCDSSGRDRPPFYGHILLMDIGLDRIAVWVQLFVGHDYKRSWRRVILSTERRHVFLSSEEFGHYYRIIEPRKRSRYDGVVEEQPVAQIIRPAGMSKRRVR